MIPKRALHVIRSLDPRKGGTSQSLTELALATTQAGQYTNSVLEFSSRDRPSPQASGVSMKLPWNPISLYLEKLIPGDLSHIVGSVDIVHIHGLWQAHSAATGFVAARLKKPFMVSAHGMLEPWALNNKGWKKVPYAALIERPHLQRAACLRALTVAEAEQYRSFGLRAPIAVIPNGVRRPPEAAFGSSFRSAFSIPPDQRLILFLSRVHYKKGIDILCRAWAEIAAKFPDALLVVSGPDDEDTLSQMILLRSSLGISNRILFTGMLDNEMKWGALAAAHCFVLPSHSEGFSVAILEALASSIPVIVSRQCNFPAISGTCGWVIEPVQEQLRAALVESLCQSSLGRRSFSSAAKRLADTRYSWAAMAEMFTETYNWILGGTFPSRTQIIQ